MKILLINNYLYPRGGAETATLNLGNLLVSKGHEVKYFGCDLNIAQSSDKYTFPYKNYFEGNFFKLAKNLPQFYFSIKNRRKIKSILSDFQPDIVHVHNIYGMVTYSILPIIRKNKIPIVATIHDLKLLCPTSLFLDKNNKICELCANGNVIHCIKKKCNRNSYIYSLFSALDNVFRNWFYPPSELINHFIFPSYFHRKKHESNFSHGITSTVISNFIFLNKPSYDSSFEGNYLFLGRLSKEKGLNTLINSFSDLNVRLDVAGDGPLMGEIKEYISKNDIPNVNLLGRISYDKVTEVIKQSKFLILPSECFENNPMSIIEAFSESIPVIASDIGGIPELVKDGVNGFLFKPGDTEYLKKVIQKSIDLSANDYKKMACEARKTAAKFLSQETHYKETLKIYKSLI